MKSYAHLEQKVYSDGKMIEDKDIEMKYDGNKMAIDVREDGHKEHVVISKDDIMKVFAQPIHSNNLLARLKLDFNTKKKTPRSKKVNKKKKQTKKQTKTTKKRSS
jgi:phage FluMu protein Com